MSPSASWTAAIGAGLRAMLHRRAAHLRNRAFWARETGAIQRRTLRELLDTAQRTEFGSAHGFDKTASMGDADLHAAYRDAVPVREYLDLRDRWLEPARAEGRADLMWPGVVRDWAQTSGTTAGDKYVPVSKQLLRHNYRCALDIYAHLINRGGPLPRVFGGKVLFLGGSTDLQENSAGVRTGDLSGIVTQLIRWPLSEVYLPGKKIALLSDWTTKIEAMARASVREDVRAISGMPSWTLVLLQRVMELAREEGRDVSCVRDVWPNLTCFIHGGTRYAPFEPRVRDMWSGGTADIPMRAEVYAASEAFVAVQDSGDESLRLNTDSSVFYEFIPASEFGQPGARALLCDEVEVGERYVVVLSTPAGLWRYVLGDVVQFDEAPPKGPARLRIVGRHKHFINAFGENLIVEHIENAVAAAAAETGVRVGEFTAAPVYPEHATGTRAGLELAVEWDAPEHLVAPFARAFDASLKAQNVDYGTKRKDDLGMAPPTVTPLARGTFHRWMESRGKLGGQHKCPRCANHRDILDEVRSVGAPAGAA